MWVWTILSRERSVPEKKERRIASIAPLFDTLTSPDSGGVWVCWPGGRGLSVLPQSICSSLQHTRRLVLVSCRQTLLGGPVWVVTCPWLLPPRGAQCQLTRMPRCFIMPSCCCFRVNCCHSCPPPPSSPPCRQARHQLAEQPGGAGSCSGVWLDAGWSLVAGAVARRVGL